MICETEISDASIDSEDDLGGLDVEERPGIGDDAFPALASPSPDLPAARDLASAGFAPKADDLGFGHASVDLRIPGRGFWGFGSLC